MLVGVSLEVLAVSVTICELGFSFCLRAKNGLSENFSFPRMLDALENGMNLRV